MVAPFTDETDAEDARDGERLPRPPLAVELGEFPALARSSAARISDPTCLAIVASVFLSSSVLMSHISSSVCPSKRLCGERAGGN